VRSLVWCLRSAVVHRNAATSAHITCSSMSVSVLNPEVLPTRMKLMSHLGCTAYGATPFHASGVMNLKQVLGTLISTWQLCLACLSHLQYTLSLDSSYARRMHRVSTGSVVALADCTAHATALYIQYGADKNVHCRSGLWSGRPSPQPGFKPEGLTGCFSNHLPGIHAETSAVQSHEIHGDLGWKMI
jgi:hypothetical protein